MYGVRVESARSLQGQVGDCKLQIYSHPKISLYGNTRNKEYKYHSTKRYISHDDYFQKICHFLTFFYHFASPHFASREMSDNIHLHTFCILQYDSVFDLAKIKI
jgi:hypothetical protein